MTRIAPSQNHGTREFIDDEHALFVEPSFDREPGAGEAPAVDVESPADGEPADDTANMVAPHFDSPQQQYSSAKLGMWLFLATEFLLFGGLFVAYFVLRANNPEAFAYGSQYLSTSLGLFNTVVLILSSLTIAMAVRFAQLGNRFALVATLLLTLLGGGIFLGVKAIEYNEKFEKNLYWGAAFVHAGDEARAMSESDAIADDDERAVASALAATGDAAIGRGLWLATCLACHGDRGQGMAGQAFDIRGSEFVESKTDKELVAFIKQGRMPFDPLNRTGIQMPPKGGNPMLNDGDLQHIVAFIRTLEPEPVADLSEDAEFGADDEEGVSPVEPAELFIPRSVVPPAAEGPAGLAAGYIARTAAPPAQRIAWTGQRDLPDPHTDPEAPAGLHQYFSIYYLMTGLHGLHVLAGMLVIAVVTVLAILGRFGRGRFTPVDMTGLYWHVVDVIWIVLFPLLYLIH